MPSDRENAWIWHPEWIEKPQSSSAGAFVHFRKSIDLKSVPEQPFMIRITADTRYKVYINSQFVHSGPVKGDEQAWFYDTLDIQPHLRPGRNNIAVHVLRFYHGSQLAPSFPRTAFPGLYIQHESSLDGLQSGAASLRTDETWETAVDPCRVLPVESNFDYFLQTFEIVDQRKAQNLAWCAAKPYSFLIAYGLLPPWKLHPRMIPFPRTALVPIDVLHNIRSPCSRSDWETVLCHGEREQSPQGLRLAAGSTHHVEGGVNSHTTAYVSFRFARPSTSGSTLKVTWSEGYEEDTAKLPFERKKGDRADSSKFILGPKDEYTFGGRLPEQAFLGYDEREQHDEIFETFHFRTFRYFALDLQIADDSDLILKGIDIVSTNYPLPVSAAILNVNTGTESSGWIHQLWEVSLRTLTNCMHDCYEDCPFFEQLQYTMDTRSSALFTYMVSRDDRLARQAMMQLHNSFQPAIGLTASRAPSHHLQIISHFSLFWICMVVDHYEHFADAELVARFIPVIDGILHTFRRRLDSKTGLIRSTQTAGDWEFSDWSEAYRPMGTPPAAKATGFMTHTSQLFAYTLQRLCSLEGCLSWQARADEHLHGAQSLVRAIQEHCFDGTYFTDGLAKLAEDDHYSEQSQVWAVLCGAITGSDAANLLNRSLSSSEKGADSVGPRKLTKVSIAMAFYSLRALSAVGEQTYESHFFQFWEPWREQLALNMTTWVEDYVTQRSDCHAWGSLPLYEYTTEVAGFKPEIKDGERILTFKPRLRLFESFEAKVPVSGFFDRPIVARVCWKRDGSIVILDLSWEGDVEKAQGAGLSFVLATFPDGSQERVKMFDDRRWELELPRSVQG